MKFELKCQHVAGLRFPGTKITMEFESESLEDILEEFSTFLRGCGFAIDGTLGIVSDEEIYGTDIRTDYSMD